MLDRLLRRVEVERATGLSRSAIYERVKDGRFPLPVRLTVKSVAWRESDVRAWIESREQVERRARAADR